MKIVFISDTHGRHDKLGALPDGDVLVHAGDCTNIGEIGELAVFAKWFESQPHKHKILIAGNHDWGFQYAMENDEEDWIREKLFPTSNYLRDSSVNIEGRNFYGTPWQLEFCGWAFNVPRDGSIKKYWDLIPENTDILITHGPAYGILDRVGKTTNPLGDELLRKRIEEVQPLIHVCGHIHGGRGSQYTSTHHINASVVNERYEVVNPPIVVNI